MLTLGHVLEALTGYQSAGGMQVITDVVIDSRLTIPGALFVALPGENTDGHNFVGGGFQQRGQCGPGPPGVVTPVAGEQAAPGAPILDLREPVTYAQSGWAWMGPLCLRVGDTLKAMQTLAADWRGAT